PLHGRGSNVGGVGSRPSILHIPPPRKRSRPRIHFVGRRPTPHPAQDGIFRPRFSKPARIVFSCLPPSKSAAAARNLLAKRASWSPFLSSRSRVLQADRMSRSAVFLPTSFRISHSAPPNVSPAWWYSSAALPVNLFVLSRVRMYDF